MDCICSQLCIVIFIESFVLVIGNNIICMHDNDYFMKRLTVFA